MKIAANRSMSRRLHFAGVSGMLVAMAFVMAGCGSGPSAASGAAPAKPVATPVPTSVADYGSVATPVLQGSLAEATGLWKKMRHANISTLGNECSQVGGDLANQLQAFEQLYMPSDTRKARAEAIRAYNAVLGATDECGIASDDGVKAEMKTAVHDMKPGLTGLADAEHVLRTWAGSAHS